MSDAASRTLFVGTYTRAAPHVPAPTGAGVHVLDFDPREGTLGLSALAAPADNPSFLAAGPGGTIYAVLEEDEGRVVAYGRAEGGRVLESLGGRSTRGSAPAFVSVAGGLVLVATYGGGAVLAFPTAPNGALAPSVMRDDHVGSGPDEERQDGPHAHCVRPTPDGLAAHATNLGTDELIVYDLGGNVPARAGALRLPPGSGPRHVAHSPDGTLAAVTLELAGGVATLRLGSGAATPELLRVRPPAHPRDQPAELAFSPDGRYLYVSVRGRDALDVYAVDAATGELTPVQQAPTGGRTPRHFVCSPDGAFVLVGNQDSGSVAVLRRDADTGRLGEARLFPCPTPAALLLT